MWLVVGLCKRFFAKQNMQGCALDGMHNVKGRPPVAPTFCPRLIRALGIVCLCLTLFGCATTSTSLPLSTVSHLRQGKSLFERGFYKKAMRELLPLACDGVPEAQYAVGYMYYYGYGVAQDPDAGYFWVKRSADKGYPPAKKALAIMVCNPPIDASCAAKKGCRR